MDKEKRKSRRYYSTPEDFIGVPKKITKLLEKESDRGAILIIGAYLDELLSLIIRGKARTDKDAEELLNLNNGPAGTFSSRIALCVAFGFISPDEADALTLIRKIRNAAAHFDTVKGKGFDVLFDNEVTCNLVDALAITLKFKLESRKPEYVRNCFVIYGRIVATKLFVRIVNLVPCPTPLSFSDLAEKIRDKHKGTPFGNRMSQNEEELLAAIKNGESEKVSPLIQFAFDSVVINLDIINEP